MQLSIWMVHNDSWINRKLVQSVPKYDAIRDDVCNRAGVLAKFNCEFVILAGGTGLAPRGTLTFFVEQMHNREETR